MRRMKMKMRRCGNDMSPLAERLTTSYLGHRTLHRFPSTQVFLLDLVHHNFTPNRLSERCEQTPQ
jgi:hypothetical protein